MKAKYNTIFEMQSTSSCEVEKWCDDVAAVVNNYFNIDFKRQHSKLSIYYKFAIAAIIRAKFNEDEMSNYQLSIQVSRLANVNRILKIGAILNLISKCKLAAKRNSNYDGFANKFRMAKLELRKRGLLNI